MPSVVNGDTKEVIGEIPVTEETLPSWGEAMKQQGTKILYDLAFLVASGKLHTAIMPERPHPLFPVVVESFAPTTPSAISMTGARLTIDMSRIDPAWGIEAPEGLRSFSLKLQPGGIFEAYGGLSTFGAVDLEISGPHGRQAALQQVEIMIGDGESAPQRKLIYSDTGGNRGETEIIHTLPCADPVLDAQILTQGLRVASLVLKHMEEVLTYQAAA